MTDHCPDIRICDNYAIRIDRHGQWWHQGAPITRHNLVVLFARQLVRAADGTYWLQTPAEKGMISVEDLPFVITTCQMDDQRITMTTNCGDTIMLGRDHALRLDDVDGQTQPAVHVRDNLWARVSRAVYYDLAARVVASPDGAPLRGVISNGVFFALEHDDARDGAAA